MICIRIVPTEVKIIVHLIFTVRKFSQDQIGPLVKKMDLEHKIDDELVKKLFECGVIIYKLLIKTSYKQYIYIVN